MLILKDPIWKTSKFGPQKSETTAKKTAKNEDCPYIIKIEVAHCQGT